MPVVGDKLAAVVTAWLVAMVDNGLVSAIGVVLVLPVVD